MVTCKKLSPYTQHSLVTLSPTPHFVILVFSDKWNVSSVGQLTPCPDSLNFATSKKNRKIKNPNILVHIREFLLLTWRKHKYSAKRPKLLKMFLLRNLWSFTNNKYTNIKQIIYTLRGSIFAWINFRECRPRKISPILIFANDQA